MSECAAQRAVSPISETASLDSRLLAALPDVAIVVDTEGTIRWGNPAAERFFARSVEESVGLGGLDFVHVDDLELVLRSLESIQSKEAGTPIEIRLRAPSGWRLMELVGAPVDFGDGVAVLLTMRDLTDRRRYELSHNQDLRFRSIVQNAPSITLLVSPEGVIESASGALTRCLGHDPEEVTGLTLSDIVEPADAPVLQAALERATRGASAGNPVTVTVRLLRHAARRSLPFELSFVDLVDDPTVAGLVVSAHDVSDRVRAEMEQRKSLSLVEATLDATAEGVLVIDTSGQFTSFNRQFTRMWSLPESVLVRRNVDSAVGFVRRQLSDPERFVERLRELSDNVDENSHDVLEFLDGRVFEARSHVQQVDDRVVGRVWSFRDVTDRRRLELDLSHQASHDPLTGLGNRALFVDRLDHAIARAVRSGSTLAVLFLDMDGFKMINDCQGHAAGDRVLRQFAQTLNGCLRGSDTAARLGGDEFGVLIEDLVHQGDALDLAERILTEVRTRRTALDSAAETTVSIGIGIYEPGTEGDQLLSQADVAMYAVKSHGGNGCVVFTDELFLGGAETFDVAPHDQPVRD